MPLLKESDLLQVDEPVIVSGEARPDFEVRNLADYASSDLTSLLLSVAHTYEVSKKSGDRKTMNTMDVWSYRIRDAIKEASQYEEITNIK